MEGSGKVESKTGYARGRAGCREDVGRVLLPATRPLCQFQKSICALNLMKRGCSVDCGASQFADGFVVLIVGLNAWL